MLFRDRIKETTVTTGSGSYLLAGAVAGFKAFPSGQVYYCAATNTAYEVGIGTVASGYLSRDTILDSTQDNEKLNWGNGTKTLFLNVPAAWFDSVAGDNLYKVGSGIFGKDVIASGDIYTGNASVSGDIHAIGGKVIFGPTHSAIYPMLKRDSLSLQVRKADDLGYTSIRALEFTANETSGVSSFTHGNTQLFCSPTQVHMRQNSNGYGNGVYVSSGAVDIYINNTLHIHDSSYGLRAVFYANGDTSFSGKFDCNNILSRSSGIFGKDVIVSGRLVVPTFTSVDSTAQIGNLDFAGGEIFYNSYPSGFIYRRAAGYAAMLFLDGGGSAGDVQLRQGANSTAGSIVNGYGSVVFKTNANGMFAVGGNISAGAGVGTGATVIGDSTQNVTFAKNIVVNSSGIFGKDVIASGNMYSTTQYIANTLTLYQGGGYLVARGHSNGGILENANTTKALAWGVNSNINGVVNTGTQVATYNLESIFLKSIDLVTTRSGFFQNGIQSSGNLDVLGSQIDFRNLPVADPGVAGRLYRSGQFVLVSI